MIDSRRPEPPPEMVRISPDAQPVARIGFGCCPLGGHGWGRFDERQAREAIMRAVELGVLFFDTADVYGFGKSESILGETLREFLGPARDGVFISSKFGVRWDSGGKIRRDSSPAYLRQALEGSLKRLNRERIDLYQIHWPDESTPVEATLEELLKLRDEGKIGAIGLSNFSPDATTRICQDHPIASHQFQYSLAERGPETELLPQASSLGLKVITWGSLAQGLFSGKYDRSTHFGDNDRRHRYENFKGERLEKNLEIVTRLRVVAERYGKTPAQVALRWLLDDPRVSIPLTGVKTPEQIEGNVGALGWRLEPSDREFLTKEPGAIPTA